MAVTHLLSPADILWNLLEDYGHDAESIFAEEGIDREMILKPGERITNTIAKSLWSKVTRIIDDPCFGLHGVKFWHPSHFSALGHAWLAMQRLLAQIERIGWRIRLKG